MPVSHLRIDDCNISLNEAIISIINADSGHHKLSILHHSAGSGWPVLGTHLHPSLLTPTQHHHYATLPLIEHLHKVPHCGHHWALSNDETFLLLIALCIIIIIMLHVLNLASKKKIYL